MVTSFVLSIAAALSFGLLFLLARYNNAWWIFPTYVVSALFVGLLIRMIVEDVNEHKRWK